MNSYRMRFRLHGDIYELLVGASSSGSAIRFIEASHAGATDITVVGGTA